MKKRKKEKSKPIVNIQKINAYLTSLREQERSAATIQKYGHDLRTFLDFAGKMPFSKITVIAWKGQLMASYASATVNSMLAAINGYLRLFRMGRAAGQASEDSAGPVSGGAKRAYKKGICAPCGGCSKKGK